VIEFECAGPARRRIAFRHGGSCLGKGHPDRLLGVARDDPPFIDIWIAGHIEFGSTEFHSVLAHEAVHAATFILTLDDLKDVEALPRTVHEVVGAILDGYNGPLLQLSLDLEDVVDLRPPPPPSPARRIGLPDGEEM
jgi:hypothetical protein